MNDYVELIIPQRKSDTQLLEEQGMILTEEDLKKQMTEDEEFQQALRLVLEEEQRNKEND